MKMPDSPDIFLRIESLPETKLIGKRMQMSLSDNKTFPLWSSFMPRRKEIRNNINADLFSMQVYDGPFNYNPDTLFEKWAAVAVTDFDAIPHDMEAFTLTEGLYAVFIHKGAANTGPVTFRYIFETWFPTSGYALDNRPHFEILGAKYKNNAPDSEEEIWIPVKAEQ